MTIRHILLLFIIAISSIGCTKKYSNIVFFEDFPGNKAWIGRKNIIVGDMNNNERRNYIRFSYDPIKLRLYAWNLDMHFEHLFLIDVTEGYYASANEIQLETPNGLDAQFLFLYNGISLIEYRWGLYGLVDLENGVQYLLDIREKVDPNITRGTIGYDGLFILFRNGYYNIADDYYHPYSAKLNFPRAVPKENAIIGIDDTGFIAIYNYLTQSTKNTGIRRTKFNSGLEYFGSDLFFLWGNSLYFAADNICIANMLAFEPRPANRMWFKYDIEKKTKERIYVPSGYCKILGETNL
jgi:hypothetical protein